VRRTACGGSGCAARRRGGRFFGSGASPPAPQQGAPGRPLPPLPKRASEWQEALRSSRSWPAYPGCRARELQGRLGRGSNVRRGACGGSGCAARRRGGRFFGSGASPPAPQQGAPGRPLPPLPKRASKWLRAMRSSRSWPATPGCRDHRARLRRCSFTRVRRSRSPRLRRCGTSLPCCCSRPL